MVGWYIDAYVYFLMRSGFILNVLLPVVLGECKPSSIKHFIDIQTLSSVANFAAYTFAPPILITPLGASSVIVGSAIHIPDHP